MRKGGLSRPRKAQIATLVLAYIPSDATIWARAPDLRGRCWEGDGMDVGELLALLRRRWAVLVPLLALTLVGIGGAWAKIPTQYQSQIQLTMLNAPKITDEPG